MKELVVIPWLISRSNRPRTRTFDRVDRAMLPTLSDHNGFIVKRSNVAGDYTKEMVDEIAGHKTDGSRGRIKAMIGGAGVAGAGAGYGGYRALRNRGE